MKKEPLNLICLPYLGVSEPFLARKTSMDLTGNFAVCKPTFAFAFAFSMEKREETLNKIAGLSSPEFKNLLGISKESFLDVYNEIDTEIDLRHLIWTLHFLRHYPTEYEAAFYWQVDFKTWRKYVFSTAIKLAQNLHEVPKDILILAFKK